LLFLKEYSNTNSSHIYDAPQHTHTHTLLITA